MKNLKRLMSVVLSVVMLLSFVISTSAATFTDVAETDKGFQAIEVLAALKILEGKEAGVFDPEANIKRSEFATVICRAMNQSPVGVATFSDVPEDHWAYNYIAWAASQGIVKGKGEGKFDPDANVTYNEAITMIVRAMGYEYYVEEYLGGYPTGYARVAGSYKMDAGVNTANGNAAATRADVAMLVYNAFDAPLMDYNYAIGSDMEYVIYNGSRNVDDEKRTLLSYYSDIYKFKATVVDTFKNNASLADKKGKKMTLNVLSTYGFDVDWINEALNDLYRTNLTVYANNDAWAAYAGYTVDAYIALNADDKLEVVAMAPVASGDELVIENASEVINKSVVSGGVSFEYEDENGRKQTPDILYVDEDGTANDAFAQVYVNNKNLGNINAGTAKTAFESLDDGAFSSVTLLDADNDSIYEAIYLTSYIYGIVEKVDADYEIIELTNGDALELSEDDVANDEFVYTIYKDGAEISISDVVAGDLLNIVIGNSAYDDITKVGDIDTTFVDIYVTNNTIESSVSSYNPGLDAYTIDGELYYLADTAEVSTLNPGDTGIFYITIDGYIYDADFTSTHSDNYGIILEMGDNPSAFGTTWEIKILDKNNNVATYAVKSSMFITSVEAELDVDDADEDSDTTDYIDVYARRQYKSTTNLDAKMGAIETAIIAANEAVEANAGDIADAAAAVALLKPRQEARLVTFKVVNDEITELVFPTRTAGDRNLVADDLDGNYSSKTGRLDGMELLDSSVLFNIPVAASNLTMTTTDGKDTYALDIDDFQVYAQSGLANNKPYTGFVYDYDSNTGAFGAALLTNSMGFAGNETALAVVISNATGLDANGNSTNVITFMQAGETKSLALADAYKASNYDMANAATGDVFQYTASAAGEILKAEVIYTAADTTLLTVGEPDEIGYIAGLVTKNTSKVVNIANSDDADAAYAWDLEDGCTNVLFNVERAGKANAFNAKNGTSYIRAWEVGESATAFNKDAYVIVAKTDDGVIVDVVAYLYSEDYLTADANDAIDTDAELIAEIVTPLV